MAAKTVRSVFPRLRLTVPTLLYSPSVVSLPELRASDPEARRLAVYSYLRPLLEGRRVLELGSGHGAGAAYLLAVGASAVVGAEDDPLAYDEARQQHDEPGLTFVGSASPAALKDEAPYDVVIVPEAAEVLRGGGPFKLAAVSALLAPGGHLVCLVANGDATRGEGLAYYEVLDALSPHFPRVRMFGQTPFAAFGLAEFDDTPGGLRVDSGLVDESAEQPGHYLAVAGPDEALSLGYALVQVPVESLGGHAEPALDLPPDLRRQLADAQGKLDGVVRVSRAQAEEIEELRARLRRASQDRTELDEEVIRLRRALAEADESVVSLTRRTTEGMNALAQRLTAGLRGERSVDEGRAAGESALFDRDERIATLEAERQDLAWRLGAAEEQVRRAGSNVLSAAKVGDEELDASLAAREQALEEYRRAAGAHMDEVARLTGAITEQSAALTELEDALRQAETRLSTAEAEAMRMRRLGAESEDADRQRRSRLAELEGTLLRLQRQAALEAERRPSAPDGRAAVLESELAVVRARLREEEERRAEADRRSRDAAARIAELEGEAADHRETAETEEALRARIAELEATSEAGSLSVALAEVDRLRTALERSEEQLWDARGRLMADRERLEDLERLAHATAARGAQEVADLLTEVLGEVASLESGLRGEVDRISAVERALAEWRMALGGDDGAIEAASPSAGDT
jgi:chromosome segregation ATPase/SAM-dependent methyltransferase